MHGLAVGRPGQGHDLGIGELFGFDLHVRVTFLPELQFGRVYCTILRAKMQERDEISVILREKLDFCRREEYNNV